MYNPWFNGSNYLSSTNAYNNKLPSNISVSSSSTSNSSNYMAAWIGPAISAAGSIMSSLLGSSAKTQYDYQSRLNAQQQQYARENAATEYERQMQLTRLNPLLQKQGMINAGINPSFANGSAVAGASSVNGIAAPSAGNAPNVPNVSDLFQTGANAVSTILGSAGVLSDNSVKQAQAANIGVDTQYKQAQLSTYYRQVIADLNQKIADTREKNARAFYQECLNDLQKKYGESNAALENATNASNARISEADAAVRGAMNDAIYRKLVNEADELSTRSDVNKSTKKNLDYTRQQVLPAQADNLRAGAEQARAQSRLCIAQESSVKLDNAIKENPTVKDARVIQEVVKSAPTNVAQAVFSNPWYKRYLKACETGRKLNYEEVWNFQRLCQQYALISSGVPGTTLEVTLPPTSSVQNPTTIK